MKNVDYIPAPRPELPFSSAVRVDRMIFVSGQLGYDPATLTLVPGGLEAETHQMFRHIESILQQAGGNLDSIVKCTVFLADMSDWPAFNAIYAAYFRGPLPARSALAAKGLAFGARVEMECVAVVDVHRDAKA